MKKLIAALMLGVLLGGCAQPDSAAQAPIKVKVVVVTMFEIGEDEGDKPGEFQLWKQGQQLSQRFVNEAGFHDFYLNPETGVLGIVTGMGNTRAAAAIMGLGLDNRFDLTQAYWLVAGISGIDPADGSIGSAVWADYLIDGDLAHQIDGREIPDSWPTGYFPLFADSPYPKQANGGPLSTNGEMFELNKTLSDWAYNLTKSVPIVDTEPMQTLRAMYVDHPNALLPPKVMKGDQLAASTFWHGKLFNQWANDWTAFWTDGKGNFVTSAMEDTGTYQALTYLTKAGKADKERLMVLRTASNFTMQPKGLSAAENLASESSGAGYAGMQPSLQAAYDVGSTVVNELVENWQQYEKTLPRKE